MNRLHQSYSAFIESVCTKFDCRDALPALQEGFRAYCEAAAGRRYRKPALDTDYTAENAESTSKFS